MDGPGMEERSGSFLLHLGRKVAWFSDGLIGYGNKMKEKSMESYGIFESKVL